MIAGKRSLIKTASALAAMMLLAGGMNVQAAEVNLRASSTLGPKHVMAKVFPAIFKKMQELTNGRYSGTDTPSGLVAQNEALTALRDGVIDMGVLVYPFYSSDFVETALPSELALASNNYRAVGAAVAEYVVTCEACQKEFAKFGLIYTGTSATPPYQVLATSPIQKLEDFAGKRLRTPGGVYTAWANYMGAQGVQMPITEVFESMSQGTLSGAMLPFSDVLSQQLQDVVKDVAVVNWGIFSANSAATLGRPAWNKMSADDRRNWIKAVQYGLAESYRLWDETATAGRKAVVDAGGKLLEPAPDTRAKMDEFLKKQLDELPSVLEKRGIKDAKAKVDRYLTLLRKWEKLLAGHNYNNDELADLMMKEIWSKVDLTKYGM